VQNKFQNIADFLATWFISFGWKSTRLIASVYTPQRNIHIHSWPEQNSNRILSVREIHVDRSRGNAKTAIHFMDLYYKHKKPILRAP
jgi:hypothetical protein